jgi:DNA-directed RNA polymerase III subunit RPC1
VDAILRDKKLKLKPEHVQTVGNDEVRVFPARSSTAASKANVKSVRGNDAYFILQTLKTTLPNVIVQGIPSISRAVINRSEGGDGGDPRTNLLIEGSGLLDVLGKEGIDPSKTESNHISECELVLGIEAARVKIMQEIRNTYNSYGMGIDTRHLMLLADVMTYKGMVRFDKLYFASQVFHLLVIFIYFFS